MTLNRTSLTRHAAGMREPDPMQARRAARETYASTGGEVVLINRSWLTGWGDQKQLDILAEKAGLKGKK